MLHFSICLSEPFSTLLPCSGFTVVVCFLSIKCITTVGRKHQQAGVAYNSSSSEVQRSATRQSSRARHRQGQRAF
jgi:hypothetical protein